MFLLLMVPILEENNLWTKRPGTGIPSAQLPNILGKSAKKDIKANVLLKEEDIA